MIRIIYTESKTAKPYFDKADVILTPERYEHFLKLKMENDKLDCLAVGLLLKHCINDMSLFCKDKNGCPRLKDGRYISISHSGGVSAVALSDAPIGLDIQEHTERQFVSIAKIVFCKNEIDYIQNNDNQEQAFYKLWCLKESYMKARGLGFSIPPKSFSFDLSGNKPILSGGDNADYSFKYFKINNLSAAVCFQGDDDITLEKFD